MMIVHVTDVSTLGFYTKCMFQVGLHGAGIISTIACYRIGALIPDCDCQYAISYYCIYRS